MGARIADSIQKQEPSAAAVVRCCCCRTAAAFAAAVVSVPARRALPLAGCRVRGCRRLSAACVAVGCRRCAGCQLVRRCRLRCSPPCARCRRWLLLAVAALLLLLAVVAVPLLRRCCRYCCCCRLPLLPLPLRAVAAAACRVAASAVAVAAVAGVAVAAAARQQLLLLALLAVVAVAVAAAAAAVSSSSSSNGTHQMREMRTTSKGKERPNNGPPGRTSDMMKIDEARKGKCIVEMIQKLRINLHGSSIITSTKVKERKKKAIRCIGSTNLEQFHTFGYGTNSVFTNSGFCNKDADNVLNDLLKDEEYGSGTFENVFRSSDINYSACSECCKVIQPTSSETEQHTVISAIHADEQLDKLVESMVMANGGSEARSSSNQTVDRTCIDVEKILHNELYRRPFQQFLEQQFCAENINFYMAVEEYRSIPDSNVFRKRAEVARQIFERYFAPNGIEPVNIDNSTSKSIRDAVMSGNFTPQLYDVAQYQIFHLLKYDCWPRYLRAGGVAPTIDDGPDGTSGTPTTDGSNFRARSHCIDLSFLTTHCQMFATERHQLHLSNGEKVDGCNHERLCIAFESEYITVSGMHRVSVRKLLYRIVTFVSKRRGDKKRKSLIWHGLRPRFSRWKKAWSDASDSLEQNCDHGSSALVQETAEQYASPQFSRSQPSSRHSSQEQLGSSGEAGNAQDPLFVKSDSELRTEMLSKYSSLRRRGFTAARKQRLLLTETIHSDAPPPSTSSSRVTEVCTKFCTLMLDDTPCVEQIALHDPTESVGKWTATVAAQHGMDPRATEVVDAQSGATIDPARQAIDALNNRCVRLLPVLHFAAEIMIPNASNKTGTSANSRIVLLRARHGLSLNAVLRPVLAKYLIDYDSCVVVLPSSFDAVSWQTTVGTIRQRFVLVMTQQKYQERRHSPKREIAKEFHSTQFSTPAVNLPFYQHGDVAFVELPADFDLRTGKMNATRSFSNSKTDHTSGLLKFVRKASQAVTNREPSSDSTGPSSSSYQQHALSVQQQRRQHSGGHSYSQLASSSYTDEIRRKSLGTFQRTTNTAMADIPYCGEDTAVENLRLPETLRSTDSRKQKQIDGRERMFEIPEFLRKETTPEMRDMDKKLALIDSNTPKIPSLYTSTVSSDKDFSPGDCKGSLGWQRADYV
ncbi:Regulator of G protein signaling domain protein [Dirofilaria immitis]|nr:Regulator of G protein signaling domain protein [Dirofilaria immitis]